MKIGPVAAQLFRAAGQTDRHDEANSRFSSSLQTHFKYVLLQFYVGCCTSLQRSFATRVSQLKIWNFWGIGVEINVCRCTFNRYSVITQFANSPLDSSSVVVAITENYSTSKLLKVSREKSHILSYDTVVANEWYIDMPHHGCHCIHFNCT